MAEYISRTYYGDVIRRSDSTIVAPTGDDQNPDFVAWAAWCAAGNVPDVDDAVPEHVDVPHVVSRRQMLTVLELSGLLTTIENFVATQSRIVQIAWRESNEFQRDNQLINQMAPLLNITQKDVDDLFILAASLGS